MLFNRALGSFFIQNLWPWYGFPRQRNIPEHADRRANLIRRARNQRGVGKNGLLIQVEMLERRRLLKRKMLLIERKEHGGNFAVPKPG